MKKISLFIILFNLIVLLISCNIDNNIKTNVYISINNEEGDNNMSYFNFNNKINSGDTIKTKFNGNDLILIDLTLYDGPLTMQLLPYGGIQSVYNYNLIIHFKNGYYKPSSIIYEDKEISVKEFIENNENLVNVILG